MKHVFDNVESYNDLKTTCLEYSDTKIDRVELDSEEQRIYMISVFSKNITKKH